MLKIAVLVSGGGTNLQAIMDRIEDGMLRNVSLELVVSNKRNAYALERAAKHGVKGICISPKDYEDTEEFADALITLFQTHKIDLIVLAGYLVILPRKVIAAYKNAIINIHPSLIPSFCGDGFYGLGVHEAALQRGVKITGATVHYVDEGTDTGPILLQKAVMVNENDTKESLQKRVMEEAEWVILPEAIKKIAEEKQAQE